MIKRVLCACALMGMVLGLDGCSKSSPPPEKPKTSTSSSAPADPPPAVPRDATKLVDQTKLPDLKGNVKPLADYMGKKGLMIIFVDIKCPFSGTALKDMPAVVKTLEAQGVSSVVINNDDPKDAVEKTYDGGKVGSPIVYDTGASTREGWDVRRVPTVIFVSADKKIVYQGGATWADLAVTVEKSLGLTPGSIPVPAGTGGG